MPYRMTVVLEYPNAEAAPQVSARTRAKDLGDGEVVCVQFSDALRELEVLEEHATDSVKQLAHRAALSSGRCNGECKGHPFNCYGHPNDCGCSSEPAPAEPK